MPLSIERRDANTGYVTGATTPSYVDGCECQIDKGFPAVRKTGEDGRIYCYNYDIFIPKAFMVTLAVGQTVELTMENGECESFTIQGVDSLNRRYTEIWG